MIHWIGGHVISLDMAKALADSSTLMSYMRCSVAVLAGCWLLGLGYTLNDRAEEISGSLFYSSKMYMKL